MLVPAALLVATLLMPDIRPRPATPDQEGPLEVEMVASRVDDARSVIVRLRWGEPVRVPGIAGGGTVTRILVRPGEELTTGDPVVAVDGVRRAALASRTPLTAPVGPGSDPAEIAAVLDLLEATGHLDERPGAWTGTVAAAVRAYREEAGAAPAPTLDPSMVVWLPQEPFRVAAVHADPGFPPPGPTEALLEGPGELLEVAVDADSREAVAAATLPGDYVASLEGVELGPWDPGSGMPAATRQALAGELAGQQPQTVTLEVALRQPVALVSLPASAVTTDGQGRTCVWRAAEPPAPVEVEILRGSSGRVQVAPVEGDPTVLAYPAEVVDGRPSCAP